MLQHCCIGKCQLGRILRNNYCKLLLTGIFIILTLGEIQYRILRAYIVVTVVKDAQVERDVNLTCIVPLIANVAQFFNYGKRVKPCRKLVGFGGPLDKEKLKKYYDGEKIVCLDEEYDIKAGNCTVLSFGIGNNWSFDDSIAEFGCKVYSFDPTIGLKDFNRSENIQFFNLGLGGTKGLIKFGDIEGKVDRYQNILAMLNLINHEIDYLKIDIEGSEVNFFNDIFGTSPNLLKNVKQIGMEIHPGKVNHNQQLVDPTSKHDRIFSIWNGISQLECAGFQLLSYQPNEDVRNLYKWMNRVVSTCYEVVWGKIPIKRVTT